MIHDLLIQKKREVFETNKLLESPWIYYKFLMFPGCYDGFSIGVAARIFFVYLQAAQQRGGTNCCHARL